MISYICRTACLLSLISLGFSDPLCTMNQELQLQPDHEICALMSKIPDLGYSFWTSPDWLADIPFAKNDESLLQQLCNLQDRYPTLMSTMKDDGKFIKMTNKKLGPWLFLFDAQTNEKWINLTQHHPMRPGKYSYFKLHLQVKPEYLYACAETFANLLLREKSSLQASILGFKVSLNPSASYHINEHRLPTMVIYLDPIIFPKDLFVGPDHAKNPHLNTIDITKTLVKTYLDKILYTIYNIFGKKTIEQIGLDYTPRFNKRINKLMYIAGYHSEKVEKYQLSSNSEDLRYYTDDLVFVIGAEYEPTKLIL